MQRSGLPWRLGKDAAWKAAERERNALQSFLTHHPWRADDLAHVLDELPQSTVRGQTTLLELLFNTKEGWRVFFAKVKVLHTKLEREGFGIPFGLFLHLEMKLTLPKIQRCVEAACKSYHRNIDRYKKKAWLTKGHL